MGQCLLTDRANVLFTFKDEGVQVGEQRAPGQAMLVRWCCTWDAALARCRRPA